MRKKFLKSAIALLLCAFMFVGCSNNEQPSDVSSLISSELVSSEAVTSVDNSIKLNGINLKEYCIVFDEDDLFSQFTAEILAEKLNVICGEVLDVVPDSVKEQKNELLIGKTNRIDSNLAYDVKMKNNEFILTASTDKVVMAAKGYMVGGAANALLTQFSDALEATNIKIEANTTPVKYEFEEAENAILMIGDGMGENHIEAAEKEGMTKFYAKSMPNIGTAVTYSYSVNPLGSAAYTDSAAAGTALATGYKTINGYVGLNHNAEIIPNVRELAQEAGAKTAILTTDAITGATPGAFLAHCSDRGNTSAIQSQIDSLFIVNKITIAEGSLDENLLSREKKALETIAAENSRFFMMLEEGYIDKKSHSNDYDGMVHTVKRFNDTIAYAMEFTLMHPNTVLIVTADHETGDLREETDGSFKYYSTNHTNKDVPLFAMGKGTEILTKNPCDNTNIAKFIAKVYGKNDFGQ